MRQGGVLSYFAADHLGSASLTMDASGNKTGELKYKPFGETRYTWGTTPTDRKFTGQRQEDSSLGSLYDYGARFYSPVLGRFLSADTMVPSAGNPQAFNRYSYVSNNPIKNTDPTGHKECYGYAPSNVGGYGVGNESCAGGDWDAVRAEENLGKMQDQVRAECAAAHGACDTKPQDMLVLAGIGLVGMVAPELIGGGMDIAGGLGVRATVACVNTAICDGLFGLGGASAAKAASEGGAAAASSEAASGGAETIGNLKDILMPNGNLIGEQGQRAGVQILQGGETEAKALFEQLTVDGKIIDMPTYSGKMYELPNGGTVGYRISTGYGPTIDIGIPGIPFTKIHFGP